MELTKYELARVIGARALQLSAGAPPMLKASSSESFILVAERELEKSIIPLVVVK